MSLGVEGEKLAAIYLAKKGYIVLEQNFRKHFGEIDIIARKGKTVVFVEVKTRMNMNYGLPREAVTSGKLRKIMQVAEYYISNFKETGLNFRIDLIEILYVKGKPYVCHTENITL